MTDNELLLLAAKAAGATPYNWDTSRDGLFISNGVPILLAGGDPDGDWNPLDDDGQALRMAVRLGMLFTYMHDRFELFQRFYRQELDQDRKPTVATRRAIVRTAAEIGKNMR